MIQRVIVATKTESHFWVVTFNSKFGLTQGSVHSPLRIQVLVTRKFSAILKLCNIFQKRQWQAIKYDLTISIEAQSRSYSAMHLFYSHILHLVMVDIETMKLSWPVLGTYEKNNLNVKWCCITFRTLLTGWRFLYKINPLRTKFFFSSFFGS